MRTGGDRLLARAVLYSLVTCTLPCLVALAAVAFIVFERVAVDPTVSAGVQGTSPVPVWSAPLAIFAVLHSIALLLSGKRLPGAGLAAGLTVIAICACFLYFAGPVQLSETLFGLFFILLFITLVGIFLWPVLGAFAVMLSGALLGLSIYLPLVLARRLGNVDFIRPSAKPLVIAGVFTAVAYALAFGVPSWSAMAALGRFTFPQETVSDVWHAHAPIIAACCAIMSLAGIFTFGPAKAIQAWIIACVLPIGALVATAGPMLRAAEKPFARSNLARIPPFSAFSHFARDGRARAADPIMLSGLEFTIDRALVRYQLADDPTRRISTVAFWPPPDLTALGVRGTIILNAWRPFSARQEAEKKGAVCTTNATRGVIECRYPTFQQTALEIDAAEPTRWLERNGCLLILTELGGVRLHARVELDCATIATWQQQAASIEAALKQSLKPGRAPR